ncbi:maleylpyruvate isomerase family mycothiol-dependent enzyme [Pseudonocardia acidicola]|nr:maleylpyruvate isomerase family mycothiol-dependent enzyme [Pseudonocardia acidicola]
MSRHDLAVTRPWMAEGTTVLFGAVDRLSDGDLRGPGVLPGWTRAHVIGHVARNAEALGRLAAWARTGVETPMYADRQQRATEIEASAAWPAATLRADLTATAAALDTALDALDDAAWKASVRSAQGRVIPAAEIPWMRVREVWLHAVDLDAGVGVADLPAGVVDALLDDVTGALSGRDGCPPVRLEPADRDRGWRLGPDDADPVVVAAPAADLLAWAAGRDDGARLAAGRGAGVPELPRWL